MPKPKLILFRVDAGPQIGQGHLMRCVALAEELTDRGHTVYFAMHESTPDGHERLADIGVREIAIAAEHIGALEDRVALGKVVRAARPHAIVLDSYRLDETYLRSLNLAGARVLLLDDLGRPSTAAQLVVNQNAHARATMYSGSVATLLLGPGFALIRRSLSVTAAQAGTRSRALVNHVLVTMGGTDPSDATTLVLDAIRSIDAAWSIDVVLGAAAPFRSRVMERFSGDPRISFHHAVDNMADLYQRADMAITAGGSTNWETALFGLPAVVIVTAENQRENARALEAAGRVLLFPEQSRCTPAGLAAALVELSSDPARRTYMREVGRAMVDGRGAQRVADALFAEEDAHV